MARTLAVGRILALWVGLVAAPVHAASFVDPVSGFKVDPPAPFFVLPAKSTTYDLAVVINSQSGSPSMGKGDNFLCQIGYKSLPDNNDLAQDEINLQSGSPDRLEGVAAALSRSFEVTDKAVFELNGATGIELIGKPKNPDQTSSVFVSMIETPAGRTTLNCATRVEEMDKAADQFRLIRSSITPPSAPAH